MTKENKIIYLIKNIFGKKNNFILSIFTLLCVVWLCVGVYHSIIQGTINIYIADILLNPIGIFYIFKVTKNNNLAGAVKMRFAIFFFMYGLFFLGCDCYDVLSAGSIDKIDTFYFFSDFIMIILSLFLCDKDICVIIQGFFK